MTGDPQDFHLAVKQQAARLSNIPQLESSALRRAAQAIPTPELTLELLGHACGAEDESIPANPYERLLEALVLRHAVKGSEHQERWWPALTYEAAAALQQLRHVFTLYPLRLQFLDELIEHGGPSDLLAEWHYARGNTHNVLAGTPGSLDAVADFRRAIIHAIKGRHGDMLASSTSALAKSVAALPAEVAAKYSDQAQGLLDAALASGFAGFHRALLLHAYAILHQEDAPQRAVEVLSEAVLLVSPTDLFHIELAATHVSALLHIRRFDEAIERGRHYLDQSKDASRSIELGMLHEAMSVALRHTHEPSEAKTQIEHAIGCFRGRDLRNELEARLQLALIEFEAERWDDLEEQLRFLEAHESRLTRQQRLDLARIRADAARARGHFDEHRDAIDQVVALSSDSKSHLLARLQKAWLELAEDRPLTDDLDELIVEALDQHPNDESTTNMVAHIVCNAPKQPLGRPCLDRVAAWSVTHQRFTLLAHIQRRGGDPSGARETLRRALDMRLPDHERLTCIHTLLCLLEDPDYDERARLHLELERMLDRHDAPTIRIDLASSLKRDAKRDEDALQRAWYHARRAVDGMKDPSGLLPPEQAVVAHTHTVAAEVLLALIHSRLPESSLELTELASWLETELPIPESDRAELRLNGAILMLAPGPLTLPAAHEQAKWLLVLAEDDLGETERIVAAKQRHDWISSCIDVDAPSLAPPSNELRGPFDETSQWVIDCVTGNFDDVDSRSLPNHLDVLHRALNTRRDVADAALAHLVLHGSMLDAQEERRFYSTVLVLVREVEWDGTGDKPWAALRRTVGTILEQTDCAPVFRAIANAIARSRHETPPPAGRDQPDVAEEEDIVGLHARAIALMGQAKEARSPEAARPLITEARILLDRAVLVTRRQRRPEHHGCLVSLGNAWKIEPEVDLDRALAYYTEASKLTMSPEQEGQLCKVHGDALIQRGAPEDLRRAETLLTHAVELRTGRYRAEALYSFAKLWEHHPDHTEAKRLERSADCLMAAIRIHPEFGKGLLPPLISILDHWHRRCPDTPRPGRIRDELSRLYPDHHADVRQSRYSEDEIEFLRRAIEHPAMRAFHQTASRLRTMAEHEAGLLALGNRLDPEEHRRLMEKLGRESLVDDPQGLEVELTQLDSSKSEPSARPGILAARTLVLGRLARLGYRSSADARKATLEAVDALRSLDDTRIHAMMLTWVARLWSPSDHAQDPVRDFGLAVEMLREALELQGGEDHALSDTLESLARAYRYRITGDATKNFAVSRRLYRLVLSRARQQGQRDLAANALHCLADLETHVGDGDRSERTKRSEALVREAIEITSLPHKRAEYMASLALALTQSAGHLLGNARQARLVEARLLYDQIDTSLIPATHRSYFAGNRVLCDVMLARCRGERTACLRIWREHLETLGEHSPASRSSAQHNLAIELLAEGQTSPEELREALDLLQSAARAREHGNDRRHRWESTFDLGRAIVRAMDPSDPLPAEGLPWEPAEAWDQARRWLEVAATAAEELGSGSELAEVGFWMVELVVSSASTDAALEVSECAWAILDKATPYLVTSTDSREFEARVSYRAAFSLAARLASDSPAYSEEIRWVLDECDAGPALRWMLRAQHAARRTVRARLSRPSGVSTTTWLEWQRALDDVDSSELSDRLRRVREECPSFLSEDPTLEQTWRWLEARPDSIAASIVLTGGNMALVFLARLEKGTRKGSLLGLTTSPLPDDIPELPSRMTAFINEGSDSIPYAPLTAWCRKAMIEPLLRFIGHSPQSILWVPDGNLRLLPPSALWEDMSIATATSLDLVDPYHFPGRHRSTLVGLADPGDLQESGLWALEELAVAAAEQGPIRILASVEACFGRSLLEHPDVRDTPASVRDLLAEAQEHRTIVLVAHGMVRSPVDAAIVCVNAEGEGEYLDITKLATHPSAFAGAQVILLSCSSGAVGTGLADPGGLAGTLINAGARWVVAPLWPVYVATAVQVGRRLLEGLTRSEDPWEILANLPMGEDDDAKVQRESFIAWIG